MWRDMGVRSCFYVCESPLGAMYTRLWNEAAQTAHKQSDSVLSRFAGWVRNHVNLYISAEGDAGA